MPMPMPCTCTCPPELCGNGLLRLCQRAHCVNEVEGEELLQAQRRGVVLLEDGVPLLALLDADIRCTLLDVRGKDNEGHL